MPRTFKKDIYSTRELAEIIIEDYPGRYANLHSAINAINGAMRELGITDVNGTKKKRRKVTRVNAETIYGFVEITYRRKSTPIEKAVRATEKAPESIVNKPEITDEDLERHAHEQIEKKNIPEPKPSKFEARVERFFKVSNYFLKFAQSPEERTAIWYAVAALFEGEGEEEGENT